MGLYDRDYYQADELRPLRPWDSKTMVTMLITANVAVFIANFLFTRRTGELMFQLAVFSNYLLEPLQWYHFVTYGFAHDPTGITHILFNMLSLYFLGQSVEAKYGKWEFLRFYMAALVLGGIAWAAMRFGEGAGPMLGASGAATAVAMLFVFSFPSATLQLYGIIPIKAWVLGILIVVGNLFGAGEYIAYDVHLVGAAFAALYFFGHWNLGAVGHVFDSAKTRLKQKQRGFAVRRPETDEGPRPSRDDLESDRILEKIHRQGKDSLTPREKAFMEKYSREMRQKRSQSD